MRHNNFFSAAIVLCMIVFFTMSAMPSRLAKPTAVVITWTYTGQTAGGTYTGTATASGALETSGTSTMDAKEFANGAHCSQTLVAPGGTITILSNCQYSTNTGTWRIVSGTGDYANLRGNGKLIMTFPAGVFVIESFSGRIY
jgi:hypothetical protein